MELAVGEGQPTEGRGVLSAKVATVSRNQQAGMATPPCAAGLCSLVIVVYIDEATPPPR